MGARLSKIEKREERKSPLKEKKEEIKKEYKNKTKTIPIIINEKKTTTKTKKEENQIATFSASSTTIGTSQEDMEEETKPFQSLKIKVEYEEEEEEEENDVKVIEEEEEEEEEYEIYTPLGNTTESDTLFNSDEEIIDELTLANRIIIEAEEEEEEGEKEEDEKKTKRRNKRTIHTTLLNSNENSSDQIPNKEKEAKRKTLKTLSIPIRRVVMDKEEEEELQFMMEDDEEAYSKTPSPKIGKTQKYQMNRSKTDSKYVSDFKKETMGFAASTTQLSSTPKPKKSKNFFNLFKKSASVSPRYHQELSYSYTDGFTPRRTAEAKRTLVETGEEFINQYKIEEELGRGTSSTVYKAVDMEQQEVHALKVVHRSMFKKHHRFNSTPDSSAWEDINREISIIQTLDHENIVRLHEVIDDPKHDKFYMVFDYVSGGQLVKIESNGQTKNNKLFTEDKARKYFRDLINGLSYIHSRHVLHRDIKPENLLIDPIMDRLKMVDFGVSHEFKDDNDNVTDSQGTPAFLSPEACIAEQGAWSGRAADIWACGITLYVMIFGKTPFTGTGHGWSSIHSTYEAIKNDEVDYPEEMDEQLHDLFIKILNKDPEERMDLMTIRRHPWVTRDLTEKELELWMQETDHYEDYGIVKPELSNSWKSTIKVKPGYVITNLIKKVKLVLSPRLPRRSSSNKLTPPTPTPKANHSPPMSSPLRASFTDRSRSFSLPPKPDIKYLE